MVFETGLFMDGCKWAVAEPGDELSGTGFLDDQEPGKLFFQFSTVNYFQINFKTIPSKTNQNLFFNSKYVSSVCHLNFIFVSIRYHV